MNHFSYLSTSFRCLPYSGTCNGSLLSAPIRPTHWQAPTTLQIWPQYTLNNSLPQLRPTPGNHWSFSISKVSPFPERHIVGFIQYVAFPDWLLLLSNMHLNLLYVFSWLDSSFLFSAAQYSIVWMDHSLLTPSLTEGHLGHFKFRQLWLSCYKHLCAGLGWTPLTF